MKKIVRTVLIIVAAVVVFMGVMIGVKVTQTGRALKQQVNEPIDMAQVADGTYRGESDGGLVKVEVEVEVKDHEIVNINLLKHECGKGKPAESILEEMVKRNTDDVDGVSGATASSKTIRNAVNQALQSGMEGK